MKRKLAIVLALVFAFVAVVGCTGTTAAPATSEPAAKPDSSSTAPAATTTDTAAPAAEPTREHVTITFAQFGNSLDDIDGFNSDPIKKAIEEKLDITLQYDTGADGFDDRMETQLFAGNGDDLFPTWGQADKIAKYVEEDLVWNLSEIVNADPERYPVLYKMFNDENYKAYNKLYTGDENAAYAIYSFTCFDYPSFGGVPVYNQAILDQVNGGAVPKTVDEFLAYAEAAGAAGYVAWWPRNDKLTNWYEIDATLGIPQGTSIKAPGNAGDGTILSGELGTDSEYWTISATSDASKAVVKQLAELYKNGGLSANIGIAGDFDDAYADYAAGKIGSANFGFGYPAQYRDFFNKYAEVNTDATIDALTVGYSLTNGSAYGSLYQKPLWVGAHYFVPKSCTYPDRVLDLIEYIASNEGQDLLFNCVDGKYNDAQGLDYWSKVDGAYGYSDRCRYVWFSYMFAGFEYRVDIENNSWWYGVNNPIDYSANWDSDLNKALVQKAQGVISEYRDEVNVFLPAYYSFIALPAEANDIISKLAGITNEYLSAMLVGALDIDASWADYQNAYEAAGAAQLEAMINEAVATARTTYGK